MATRGKNALDDKGYVVYTRTSTNKLWESARQKQESIIKNYYSAVNTEPQQVDYQNVADYLRRMGDKERTKEAALIEQYTGLKVTSQTEAMEFIKDFNEFLIGKEQYRKAYERIQNALANEKIKQGKGTDGLPPAISSLFNSKFGEIFGKKISSYINRHQKDVIENTDKFVDDLIAFVDKKYDEVLELTLKELLTYTTKEEDKFGTIEGYKELYELYTQNKYFKEIYHQSMRSALSLDGFNKAIKDLVKKEGGDTFFKKNVKKRREARGRTITNLGFKLEGRAGSRVRGIADEFIESLEDFEVSIGTEGTKVSFQLPGNMSKTDNMVFILEGQVDTDEIYKEFMEMNKNLDSAENLEKVNKEMKRYWDEHLSKLGNGFIIFKSNKMYGIDNIQKDGGFIAGDYALGNFQNFASSSELQKRLDITKFVKVVSNTIQGAILEGEIGPIETWLHTYVCECIAKLLLDDWEKIGEDAAQTGPTAIHVLTLEGINIPISVYLYCLADALAKTVEDIEKGDLVKIKLLPSENLYPTVEDYYKDGDVMVENTSKNEAKRTSRPKVPNVAIAWNKQRNDALTKYKISVNFYKNFRKIVLDNLKPPTP